MSVRVRVRVRVSVWVRVWLGFGLALLFRTSEERTLKLHASLPATR